jgi:predicted CXXCH cytochrome family protein
MKTMRILWAAALAMPIVLFLPTDADSRVKDTPHRLTGTNGISVLHDEVCRPCHTPHNAIPNVQPIWNHQLSTATWTLFEGADAASLTSSDSRLCLSCHDGTVALDSYGGATGSVFISGRKNLGTDLTTSHPIGVDYPIGSTRFNQPDANGSIRDSVETPTGQSATLDDGKVQCTSCHFAHGSRASYGMFLRVDNTGSKLCMSCHISPG